MKHDIVIYFTANPLSDKNYFSQVVGQNAHGQSY